MLKKIIDYFKLETFKHFYKILKHEEGLGRDQSAALKIQITEGVEAEQFPQAADNVFSVMDGPSKPSIAPRKNPADAPHVILRSPHRSIKCR